MLRKILIVVVIILMGFVIFFVLFNSQASATTDSLSSQIPFLTTNFSQHLPVLYKSKPSLTLEHFFVTDLNGHPDSAYYPGQIILLHSEGTAVVEPSIDTLFTWTELNSCSTTAFTDTVSLMVGIWIDTITTTIPDCVGDYTYTLNVVGATTHTLSTQILVTNLSRVIVTDQQGFDKCDAPSLNQLQTWWDHSPYYSVNIYIGGISRSCDNLNLNPSWIEAASQQGWAFIPTWVGPQSPCSRFEHKMSSDTNIANTEGRLEADSAVSAMTSLGFLGEKIIYYDLEGFSGASDECRTTAKSFIQGWVQRLHELGMKAGGYGGACSSYINDWATISPIPDDVWIASWYTDKYDPDAGVWDVPCVSSGYWNDHQRIRQYAGGHNETWGSLRMNIDSNAINGEVNTIPISTTISNVMTNITPIAVKEGNIIQDMQLISPHSGWAVVNGRLWWTNDQGITWRDITPQPDDRSRILAVSFLDDQNGWLLWEDLSGHSLKIYYSSDNSNNWLRISSLDGVGDIQSAHLQFTDDRNGIIELQLASSSNFLLRSYYNSMDGGVTWHNLEQADNLNTWDLPYSSNAFNAKLPANTEKSGFITPVFGWALVIDQDCSGEKQKQGYSSSAMNTGFYCYTRQQLLQTMDGGFTWKDITPVTSP